MRACDVGDAGRTPVRHARHLEREQTLKILEQKGLDVVGRVSAINLLVGSEKRMQEDAVCLAHETKKGLKLAKGDVHEVAAAADLALISWEA